MVSLTHLAFVWSVGLYHIPRTEFHHPQIPPISIAKPHYQTTAHLATTPRIHVPSSEAGRRTSAVSAWPHTSLKILTSCDLSSSSSCVVDVQSSSPFHEDLSSFGQQALTSSIAAARFAKESNLWPLTLTTPRLCDDPQTCGTAGKVELVCKEVWET